MAKLTTIVLVLLALTGIGVFAFGQGQAPPPGWGKPAALPPANGVGQVTFNHGGTLLTLPLNKIEIDTSTPGMFMVSLHYVDATQQNELDLSFSSMPKLGKNDPHPITGFVVKTKAHGASKDSANKTKCDFTIARLTGQEVGGALSCKGMTDMSARNAAPDVTDVKFEGKLK